LGVSKSKFAEMLGVHRSAVSRWESAVDPALPRIGALERIAQITGVNYEWLATGRGPKGFDAQAHELHESIHEDFAQCERESHLLKGFRELAPAERRDLLAMLDRWLQRTRKIHAPNPRGRNGRIRETCE
jgi:transcriptional regulator with XRE-family HTH domain